MRLIDGSAPKAYRVWAEDGEGVTVVFAKSRNEAKMIALGCDCCEGFGYLEISAKRAKSMDGLYKGLSEIDWYDPETRTILVRDFGWSCEESSWACDNCVAKQYCWRFEEDAE